MENNPAFNAGYGASLTRAGTVELDSMVMRSVDYQIGTVLNTFYITFCKPNNCEENQF